MAVIRHFLEAILNPFFLTLLLLAICVFILFWRGNKRWVRSGLLIALLLMVFFSTGFIPNALTRYLEDQYQPVAKVDPSVHWVVVFSGGQSDRENIPANAILYSASIKRLVEGVRLYRQLPHAKLLLSGGGYGAMTPEASRLATLAAWFAIPSTDIVLEKKSINTADEAVEIKQWLHDKPFYLVTSAIHMPRAMALCKNQGLNPIAAPTDYTYYWNDERWEKRYIPNPSNLVYLSVAFHELLGRLWTSVRA